MASFPESSTFVMEIFYFLSVQCISCMGDRGGGHDIPDLDHKLVPCLLVGLWYHQDIVCDDLVTEYLVLFIYYLFEGHVQGGA